MHYIQYALIRLIVFFYGLFPVSVPLWCAARVGDTLFFFMKKRRRITLENIDKAFDDTLNHEEKQKIARAAFQNMTVSVSELFSVKKIKKHTDDYFTLHGNEHLEKAFSEGKGVVLVISHLGSWEYLSFLPFLTGQSWTVVVKDIRNPYLNNYIKYLRMQMTVNPVEKMNAMRPIMRELKKNHGVAVLIDQWSGGEGIWTNFFGVKTSTTSIPSRLAEKTGCALIPANCLRKPNGKFDIHIHPPVKLDLGDNWERITTENLNRLLEDQIRKYPEQWLWAHRRWKVKPSQMRS